jgi:anti-anti-sigma regulatory factor
MDALRIMGLQDDFELVALEYCVTFEVSPPAWQDVRCSYVHEASGMSDAEGRQGTASESEEADTAPEPLENQGLTVPMGFDSAPAAVVELTGEILGEAADALARLEQARQGGDRLVISCANLIRVDFSAAGSVLNWVAARQSEGCQVQFRDLHRLVAAFFHVIGINEHARVVPRSN